MISDDDDLDIITHKRPPHYNNIDYREKLSLNTGDILKLRVLALNYDNEEEFNNIIVALIYVLSILI